MKPARFEYRRATTAGEAIALLASAGGEARVLAGGQTLGPMLNMRLARPRVLVDIGQLDELKAIEHRRDEIAVGACVTHSSLEDQTDASATGRLIAHVAGSIAYRAVRNRGTIGGSLAHADPAADWPVLCTLLNARLQILGASGTRVVEGGQFMRGAFTTALRPGEILQSIVLQRLAEGSSWGYCRIHRKVGEFPDAIAAVVLDSNGNPTRVVVGAIEGAPAVLSGELDAGFTGMENALRARIPNADSIDLQLHAVAVKRATNQAMRK